MRASECRFFSLRSLFLPFQIFSVIEIRVSFEAKFSLTLCFCFMTRSVVRSSRGKALIAKAGSDDLKNKANDLLTTAAEKWEETEDKPTVVTLALAGLVTLIVLSSLLGALDKVPFLGSILELVGIGYTAYFAYNNLLFTPDREKLVAKIDEVKDKVL